MAGTATEQLVGLRVPALSLASPGPSSRPLCAAARAACWEGRAGLPQHASLAQGAGPAAGRPRRRETPLAGWPGALEGLRAVSALAAVLRGSC